MRVKLKCLYCAWEFLDYVYDEKGVSMCRCPKCKDANLKVMKETTSDVFGYDVVSREDAYIRTKKHS
jgi:hypothetical protein